MPTIRIRLTDRGESPETANQLIAVLSGCPNPRFQIDCVSGNWPAAQKRSCSRSKDGDTACLQLLLFDRCPEDATFGELCNQQTSADAGFSTIVVLREACAEDIARLFTLGALDVWTPPFRDAELIGRTLHWSRAALPAAKREVKNSKPDHAQRDFGLPGIIGESPALVEQMRLVAKVADTEHSVVIRGETGTGKELFARAVHDLSPRNAHPFVAVNCGALQPELAENELFGHERGAFTGANAAAGGLVQQVNGGTLFLDEVDSLSLGVQVKLLRFLQEKQYRPLGSQKVCEAKVRVVAATNADLQAAIKEGKFRQDLFYRLAVVELLLPPLRERGADLDLLAKHSLARHSAQLNKPLLALSPRALVKLQNYDWPGNARELDNVIARAAILAEGNTLQPEDIVLPCASPACGCGTFKELKAEAVRSFEIRCLSSWLETHHGNISRAARATGMDRRAFWQLLRKHGLNSLTQKYLPNVPHPPIVNPHPPGSASSNASQEYH